MKSILAACLLLGACSSAQLTTANTKVNASIATAQSDLAKATNGWQIIKGMALIAEGADPALASWLGPRITAIDALVATAPQALGSAQADAVTVEGLVSQINGQAQTVMAAAAPAIKVVVSH